MWFLVDVRSWATDTVIHIWNFSIDPERSLVPRCSHCPVPPQPQASARLLSVSMDSPVLNISCQ